MSAIKPLKLQTSFPWPAPGGYAIIDARGRCGAVCDHTGSGRARQNLNRSGHNGTTVSNGYCCGRCCGLSYCFNRQKPCPQRHNASRARIYVRARARARVRAHTRENAFLPLCRCDLDILKSFQLDKSQHHPQRLILKPLWAVKAKRFQPVIHNGIEKGGF